MTIDEFDQNSSKRIILNKILEELLRDAPASRVRVATMGGNGLEAGMWDEAGIRGKNGWLIEKDSKLRQVLQNEFGHFHLTPKLSEFPKAVKQIHGAGAYLDLFHLDICGTIELKACQLARVLPLLAAGHGRLLAITSADARRNRSLENSEITKACAAELFGSVWQDLWDHLCELHRIESVVLPGISADSENVALREVGFFINLLFALGSVIRVEKRFGTRARLSPLAELCRSQQRGEADDNLWRAMSQTKITLVPTRLERFVYWSDQKNGPDLQTRFRMRSYLARLEVVKQSLALKTAARNLGKLLMRSEYSMVKTGMMQTISIQDVRSQKRQMCELKSNTEDVDATAEACLAPQGGELSPSNKGKSIMGRVQEIKDLFSGMLPVLAPELQQGFEELCALAQTGEERKAENDNLHLRMISIRCILDGSIPYFSETESATEPASESESQDEAQAGPDPAPENTQSEQAEVAPPKAKAKKKRLKKSEGFRLPLEQADSLRLELLRAGQAGPKALEKVEKKIQSALPLNLNLSRVIGGLRSYGGGKYRPAFVARMLLRTKESSREPLLQEFATLYGVRVEDLQAEVEASTVWQKAG